MATVNINPTWLYPGNRASVKDELKARIETLRRDAERFADEEKDYAARADIARRAREDATRLKGEYEAVVADIEEGA